MATRAAMAPHTAAIPALPMSCKIMPSRERQRAMDQGHSGKRAEQAHAQTYKLRKSKDTSMQITSRDVQGSHRLCKVQVLTDERQHCCWSERADKGSKECQPRHLEGQMMRPLEAPYAQDGGLVLSVHRHGELRRCHLFLQVTHCVALQASKRCVSNPVASVDELYAPLSALTTVTVTVTVPGMNPCLGERLCSTVYAKGTQKTRLYMHKLELDFVLATCLREAHGPQWPPVAPRHPVRHRP